MPASEASDFVRNSNFGSHLLHPSSPRKTIELVGDHSYNGIGCHRVLVTLPDGQQVEYGLAKYDYREVYVRVRSLATGQLETLEQSDFIKVGGMSLPRTSLLYIGDTLQATIRIEQVEPNRGVATWMFQPASEDFAAVAWDGLAPATTPLEIP